MDKVYNYLGEDITSIKPDVADDSFGYRNKDGILVINWEAPSDLKDSKGVTIQNPLLQDNLSVVCKGSC